MEELFIPYELALDMKSIGFDEPCFCIYYNGEYHEHGIQNQFLHEKNECSAPTFSQAFKFFREKHNLLGNVYSNASGWAWEIHDNIGGTSRFNSEYTGDCEDSGMFTSYEKAELECLRELIRIVKNK
jgi:hypothetical protein